MEFIADVVGRPFWRKVAFAACWSLWGSFVAVLTMAGYRHWTAPQPGTPHCWFVRSEPTYTIVHCRLDDAEPPRKQAFAPREQDT